MRIKTIGMLRGSAKGYVVFRVTDVPSAGLEGFYARVRTSDNGELPCAEYVLRDGACRDEARVVVTFPLFESASIHIFFSTVDEKGNAVELGNIGVSRLMLKWCSRGMRRVNPGLCERVLRVEAESIEEKRNRVEIVQVFDCDEGLVYRAWIQGGGQDALDIILRDGRGKLLPSSVQVIEEGEEGSERRCCVISFLVGKTLKVFSVEFPGCGFDAIDAPKSNELAGVRDGMMINPAIDERYSEKVGSVADEWVHCRETNAEPMKKKVSFSIIVPLYRTPGQYLKEMVDSVVGQSYDAWELVLVNASPECDDIDQVLGEYRDPRIRVVKLECNLGISGNTNAGIAVASGDYLAFLDHDDILAPSLLFEYAREIAKDPRVDILYCDEDSFSLRAGPRFSPLFKPDLNRALLYSHNYVVHCLAVSKRVLEKVELSSSAVDGAQDYDLTLKALDYAEVCKHVPKVLYHWRVHAGSTNGGSVESKPYVIQAGKRALSCGFERRRVIANVKPSRISCVYRIDMGNCEHGTLALVLVYSDSLQAERFLHSMKKELAEADSLIIVGKGAELLAFREDGTIPFESVRAVEWGEPYDYASMVNKALESVTEEYVWICRDGIRSVGESHIGNLIGWLAQGEAGIVAPKLVYPDGLVQHAGLCIESDGSIGYLNQNFTTSMGGGYLGIAECCCAYSAVAPDSFLCKRKTLFEVGGLKRYGSNVVASVVDLCFKVRSKGGHVVVLPESILKNYTHVIRADEKEDSLSSKNAEIIRLWRIWGDEYRCDVLRNPNVCIDHAYFQLGEAYFDPNEAS
ncbi:glycosyltransferase [Gordonibacter massiliensis (ex Traore et al. 2017)]|uniref:glycosyltransferase n=1 Tax=Gordonibacter massiliensis (ex Traore et al. 2017) TaxID=1841863 RepID=UPI001C8B9277|nr:glycosyltransferase [Gordonibacter massiliensis (ex Traore et al. 2017)]MBX9033651.1 glycosyltransferase [Gordonibacter massiliensis (ex Traore et al. 2017)]